MEPMTPSAAFMDTGHDHDHCMESALDRAAALCGERDPDLIATTA